MEQYRVHWQPKVSIILTAGVQAAELQAAELQEAGVQAKNNSILAGFRTAVGSLVVVVVKNAFWPSPEIILMQPFKLTVNSTWQ